MNGRFHSSLKVARPVKSPASPLLLVATPLLPAGSTAQATPPPVDARSFDIVAAVGSGGNDSMVGFPTAQLRRR